MRVKEVLMTLKSNWDTAASAIGSCRSTCNYFSQYILWRYAVFYYTSISFVAHKLIHFSSNLQFKKRIKGLFFTVGKRWCFFRRLQKVCLFYCDVFVKLLRDGSALRKTFAHSVWTPALLDGDRGLDDDDAGETERSSCEFEEDLFCSVWNVKVCLDWNKKPDSRTWCRLLRKHDDLSTEPLCFRKQTQPLWPASFLLPCFLAT